MGGRNPLTTMTLKFMVPWAIKEVYQIYTCSTSTWALNEQWMSILYQTAIT